MSVGKKGEKPAGKCRAEGCGGESGKGEKPDGGERQSREACGGMQGGRLRGGKRQGGRSPMGEKGRVGKPAGECRAESGKGEKLDGGSWESERRV